MKILVNYWKASGKWYSCEDFEVSDEDQIEESLAKTAFGDMTATTYFIEEDGSLLPYRTFKL